MNIYILAGISLSGKTTWRDRFLEFNPDVKVISADNIRGELHPDGDEGDQTNNYRIFTKIIPQRMEECYNAGVSFLVDNVNNSRQSRKLFIDFAKKYNIPIECHYFTPDIEKSVKRMENRTRKVPQWVIEKQVKNWQTPTGQEGFSKVLEITN